MFHEWVHPYKVIYVSVNHASSILTFLGIQKKSLKDCPENVLYNLCPPPPHPPFSTGGIYM